MKSSKAERKRLGARDRLLVLFLLVCLGSLCWPGCKYFAGRVEPMVLGIPFSLAFVVGWAIASFFALLAYDVSRPR